MKFKTKTENELREESLAALGDYDFEVLEASDAISKKSGNPMIKIKIGLYIDGRIKNHVFDYLMESMGAKLRHFCDTVGLLREYESGNLTADMCSGRSGRVKIVIDSKDPQYPPKNAVKDYIVRAAKPLASAAPEAAKPTSGEEDNPFV